MTCARFGKRPFDLRIDSGRLASIPSLPYRSLQLEHRAADTLREALAKRGQGTEPAGLGSPTCCIIRSLHVIRSPPSQNQARQISIHHHGAACDVVEIAPRQGGPSHRRIRLARVGSGRISFQALPGALVARIIIADEANCLGCKLSVYSHPFITVRRSFRTRFAIGQRSTFVSFAVQHFGAPQA